jgi:hypothetical protein
MKIHNPIYLPFALAMAVFLAVANHNGWSLAQSMPWNSARHPIPGTQHK